MLNQKNDSRDYLNGILKDLYHYIDVNNFVDISFNICVYKNIGQIVDYRECLYKINTLKRYLLDDQKYDPDIYYYLDGSNYPCEKKQNTINLLEKAISNKEFNYSITPFYSIRTGKLRYFKFDIEPNSKSLLTPTQVDDFIHHDELRQSYLKLILNKINKFFDNNKRVPKEEKPKVFIKCPLWLINTFKENITTITELNNYCFIFILNDKELQNQIDDKYIENLKDLKGADNRLCLEITSTENCKDSILSLIDYAMIDGEFINKQFKDKQLYFLFKNLFYELVKKHITLIGDNINNISTLETFISNKIHIISGKCLENDNKITASLSKRVHTQLRNIYDKYY